MSNTSRTDGNLVSWAVFEPNGFGASPYVEAEFARELERENARLRKDKERLDKAERMGFTRITDSERYLPKQIYFGKGTHRNIRQAIDDFSEFSPL